MKEKFKEIKEKNAEHGRKDKKNKMFKYPTN